VFPPLPTPRTPPPYPRPLSHSELAAGLRALVGGPPNPSPLNAVSTGAAAAVFLAGSSVGEIYAVEAFPGPIAIVIPRTFAEAIGGRPHLRRQVALCVRQ
jgi:hypothetical protein